VVAVEGSDTVKTIIQSNSPVLQAGKFRHQIRIVKPAGTQDSAGGANENENITIADNVWATIEALSGVEKFAAYEFSSEISHSVIIRYSDYRVTADMQVEFQGRRFQIEAVLNPDERNKMLQLLCIEVNDSLQEDVTP
jgi:SPP1 family predicted phage head-tail adaptor